MNDDHKSACEMAIRFHRQMAVAFNGGEAYIGWIACDDPALMAQQLMLAHANAPTSPAHHMGKKAAMAVMYTAMGLYGLAEESTEDFVALYADEAESRDRRRGTYGLRQTENNE